MMTNRMGIPTLSAISFPGKNREWAVAFGANEGGDKFWAPRTGSLGYASSSNLDRRAAENR